MADPDDPDVLEALAPDGAAAAVVRSAGQNVIRGVYVANADGSGARNPELGEEGHASTDQDQKLRMFRLLDGFLGRRLGREGG